MTARHRALHRTRLLATSQNLVTPQQPKPVTRSARWLGRASTRLLSRLGLAAPSDVDPVRDQYRGVVVVMAFVMVWIIPMVAVAFVIVGWQLPNLRGDRRRRALRRHLDADVLLAVELCAVTIHTGATVPTALCAVAPYLPGPLGTSLERASSAYRSGAVLDDELVEVVEQLGEPVVPLVTILRAAHLDGDPLLPALHRLADQLRRDQRRAVEADVRRLSVRLLIPLVCCSLPGFVLIGVVPLAANAFGGITH